MGGLFDYFRQKKTSSPQQEVPAQQMQPQQAVRIPNQERLDELENQQRTENVVPPRMTEQELKNGVMKKLPINQPENRAEQAQDLAQIQQEPEMARTSLSDLYGQLKTSERGGFYLAGNSKYYNAVLSALNAINSAMKGQFTQNAKENQQKLVQMERLYQSLLSACSAYTARDPSSKAGQHRKKLVEQIQVLAGKDLVSLSAIRTDFCSLPEQEQAEKNWNALLDQSRTIHLSVTSLSELTKDKAEGGQASEVYTLHKDNVTVKNASGDPVHLDDLHFFKPEDEIDTSQSTHAGKIVDNVLSRFPDLHKKDRKIIRKWAMEYKETKAVQDLPGLSKDGEAALKAVCSQLSGIKTTSENILNNLNLDKDKNKVNMTKRNVATSRVAALLGLENLVAKSETAELRDESTGHTLRGNLMEKAKGESYADFKTKEFNAFDKGFKITEPRKTTFVHAAGSFQRDMCNLQVLDAICGQVDRHGKNFFVSTGDEGELTGVQGIDNDAAFGLRDTPAVMNDQGRLDRAVYDIDSGEMVLPYMDKELAARIQNLEPDMIRFALQGLLTDDEITYTVKRLEHTQNAIKNTQQKQPERFLADDQWNDDTAQEMMKQAWENDRMYWSPDTDKSMYGKALSGENYFGRAMFEIVPKLPGSSWGTGDMPQMRRKKKDL